MVRPETNSLLSHQRRPSGTNAFVYSKINNRGYLSKVILLYFPFNLTLSRLLWFKV